MKAITLKLARLAGLVLRQALPFHHAPREFQTLGAVDLKPEILPAKDRRAAGFAWHKLKPLARLGVVPLPHCVAQRAGDPAPFDDVRDHSVSTLSRVRTT